MKVLEDHDENIGEYCCDRKCYKAPETQVDELACEKCHSFGYCKCLCSTLMSIPYNVCCSKKCSKLGYDICILCRFACYCLCDYRNNDIVKRPGIVTARINCKLVEMFKYKGERKYCCEKQCIPIPTLVVRGLACRKCKAVNYCKCECPTWMRRYKEAVEQLMQEWQYNEQRYFYNFIPQ
ncbi:hypothetical protein JTE90_014804 [Oedothorax gibbosus]|uniref:Uncharacterized protein n=1 Tax=Oedothorax gibbosus TaxID=931172 RepID=A0AAV6TF28_9ARAC|nr:hypothetical protein JTE90_014795 [Oedothorax gibbosus]KAG8170342.1 hypothetical protein JTE90_014804 [Oedothorax gibbosus]